MRVTNTMLYNNIYQNLNQQMNQLYKHNENLASGVRLHKPSDDPYAVGQSLELDKSLDQNSQWLSNMEDGKQYLGFSTDILGHAKDITQQIYQKAVQGDNDTLDDDNRHSLSLQVDSQLEELLKLSNQKYAGEYIYNGDASNVPPFLGIRDSDGKLTGVAQFTRFEGGNPNNPIYVYYDNTSGGGASNNPDALDGVYYDKNSNVVATVIDDSSAGTSSISGEKNRKTGANEYINIAINGGKTFQPNGANADNDVFQTAIKLRDGLANNNRDAIGAQIDKLNDSMSTITSEQARGGTTYNRLDLAREYMSSNEVNLTETLSNIKDTDVTSAMMEYTRLESTYSMSLQISSKIMQTSLVSFL